MNDIEIIGRTRDTDLEIEKNGLWRHNAPLGYWASDRRMVTFVRGSSDLHVASQPWNAY